MQEQAGGVWKGPMIIKGEEMASYFAQKQRPFWYFGAKKKRKTRPPLDFRLKSPRNSRLPSKNDPRNHRKKAPRCTSAVFKNTAFPKKKVYIPMRVGAVPCQEKTALWDCRRGLGAFFFLSFRGSLFKAECSIEICPGRPPMGDSFFFFCSGPLQSRKIHRKPHWGWRWGA